MKRLFLLIVLSVFIFCAKNMLFAAIEDHPMIKPVPGSIATSEPKHKNYDAYTFRYIENGNRVEKIVKGEYWRYSYEYIQKNGERDKSVSALETIENFKQSAIEKNGKILLETGAEIIFAIPMPDEGIIWTRVYCNNWKGYYEMYVVEEKAFKKRVADVTQETKQEMTAGSADTARTVQTAKATEFPSMLKEAETAYLSGNKLETVEKLKQAVLDIWNEVPLTAKNVKIVEDTSTYVPRKNNIFRIGEKIHINAQIFGYRFKRTGAAYSINITTDVYFIKDGEILAGQQDFGNFEITSPIANTEFRLDLTYWLSDAPPAIYDVQTVVHDRNSGQSTKFITQIELK